MKVLLTGAAGYTGRGLGEVLARHHWVRGLDVKPRQDNALAEMMVGDIADLEVCRRAVDGLEAVVMCHMAPRPHGYEAPPLAYDINVKGTANLYHAMVEKGIKRCVLMSTTGTLPRTPPGRPIVIGEGPYNYAGGLYGITKLIGEVIARQQHDEFGVMTFALRPSWIVYDETFITKYDQKVEHYNSSFIDPRDLGEAAALALNLPDPRLEAYQIGQDDNPWGNQEITARLGWRPRYTFSALPKPPAGA